MIIWPCVEIKFVYNHYLPGLQDENEIHVDPPTKSHSRHFSFGIPLRATHAVCMYLCAARSLFVSRTNPCKHSRTRAWKLVAKLVAGGTEREGNNTGGRSGGAELLKHLRLFLASGQRQMARTVLANATERNRSSVWGSIGNPRSSSDEKRTRCIQSNARCVHTFTLMSFATYLVYLIGEFHVQ